MLGTAGALGSGIFVLTGLAAEVAGSATILAVLLAGILSYSIAFNYCELATTYPETGGAMTYVREAWGKGLLSFLVGSMDCISSTFYTALSAVGFAYSLSVFFPMVPIVPTAIATIVIFAILNIAGVTKVGNVQMFMGFFLVFAFLVYIIAGFTMPHGFNPQTLFPHRRMFEDPSLIRNIGTILRTVALIYAAYVGFEVIADDAEEVKNPTRNIPIAIMVSLTIITIVYTLTVAVALGTLPASEIAGKATALSMTIDKFLPGPGVVIIALAGMVGALTSVNSSMLSATRESFTLSRDGAWPAVLSRLNQARVPFVAIILIGAVSILITIAGAVDFLSYITSAGYLFVLFLSNMAMITLRRKYPSIHRPFKVPLFPLTPLLATLMCLIVIFFSDIKALAFTFGVIALFAIYYYVRVGLESWRSEHKRAISPGRFRVLVPYNPRVNLDSVVKVGASLAEAESDLNMCILRVLPKQADAADRALDNIQASHQYILEKFIHYAVEKNVPLYSKTISSDTLGNGILEEIHMDNNVRLVLFKWPKKAEEEESFKSTVLQVIKSGLTNVGVLYDKGICQLENILVPVGGGYHSKLAIELADHLTKLGKDHVDYLRVLPEDTDDEIYEDQMAYLQEVVMTQLKDIPWNASLRLVKGDDFAQAIVDDVTDKDYDLLIIGSYEGDDPNQPLFGSIVDRVRREAPCSTLIISHQQSQASSWLRRQLKTS